MRSFYLKGWSVRLGLQLSVLLGWHLAIGGCAFLHVQRVEGPTLDSNFAGIRSLLKDPKLSLVSVLVVHGFGHHEPGYSQHLQDRLAEELKITGKCDQPHEILGGSYGLIRLCEYQDEHRRRLRIYELTWSRLTDSLKDQYLGADKEGRDRLLVNQAIKKDLLDDRFSDAVLYLGEFKRHMQLPIEYALCFMLNDPLTAVALRKPIDPGKACVPFLEGTVARDSSGERAIVIVTESLGSTMVWETLVAMHEDGTPLTPNPLRSVALQVLGHTRMVFMLANQLPLLRLGSVQEPSTSDEISAGAERKAPTALPKQIGSLLQKTAPLRTYEAKVIDVVAFTDPNDLLGYKIPQHLVQDFREYLRLTNVTISVARWGYFFIVADPLKAHIGHIDNDRILTMIICGFPAYCGQN